MHTLTASTIANIDIKSAWEKLSNLETSHYYVPDVLDTKLVSEAKTGVGASRHIISKRPILIETVVDWAEGSGFKLRLHHAKGDGVPPIFKRATFEYALEAVDDNSTRLTNTMQMEMKWGAIGNALGGVILKPMQKMQEQIVVGQKLFYETGEKADPAQVKQILKNA